MFWVVGWGLGDEVVAAVSGGWGGQSGQAVWRRCVCRVVGSRAVSVLHSDLSIYADLEFPGSRARSVEELEEAAVGRMLRGSRRKPDVSGRPWQ